MRKVKVFLVTIYVKRERNKSWSSVFPDRFLKDVEHAVEMYRSFPNGELAIFPGGHGAYLGSIESLEDGKMPAFNAINLIEEFLDK